jgi:head-tail adaptor
MPRHLLTLELRVQSADGSTGLTETFAAVADVWADLAGVSGIQSIGTTQVEEGVTHRAVLRWADPTTFTHFSHNGERFRVRGTRDPDMRRRWLEVMAEQLMSEAE